MEGIIIYNKFMLENVILIVCCLYEWGRDHDVQIYLDRYLYAEESYFIVSSEIKLIEFVLLMPQEKIQ